jgi:DNA invertase Pin-like site-specific DNA recombinase
MKVAIYARVSTKEKQEVQNQLDQLRQFCNREGWEIYKEYIDKESGATANRTHFKELFKDARQNKFETVVFWSLDRFSREGVRETINHLHELDSYGVEFISFTERYLDSTGMFKEAIISILATLAKQERVKISERTKAGLERARKQGKQLGRPSISDKKKEEIKKLRKDGLSIRSVAGRLNISTGTVRNYE